MPLQSPAAKDVLSLAASPPCAASGTASAYTQPTATTQWERLSTPSQAAPSMSPDYIEDPAPRCLVVVVIVLLNLHHNGTCC